MSEELRRAFERLEQSAEDNTRQIELKLSDAGVMADDALVYSAAKYFEALDKLSQE